MRFEDWLSSFPWLVEPGLQCVVSSDLDGLSCAMLQHHRLGWTTVGAYDGAFLTLYEAPADIDWTSVVFLDVEILRGPIRSIGNHLLAADTDDVQRIRQALPNCANPNLWRGINVHASFQQKYPFSTLPLLLAAHCIADGAFDVDDTWLALALHTDSSFTNAAKYQANALAWIDVMGQDGTSVGLRRFCRTLSNLRALAAMRHVNEVHGWASASGFGKNQRACRFGPRTDPRIVTMQAQIGTQLGMASSIPLGLDPHSEIEFETMKLPIHTKGRMYASFETARRHRALSMAATGRTAEGLSLTVPAANCPIELLR